jgi:ubiquinone/menaquinone biosynthesis C-methylase UbiE
MEGARYDDVAQWYDDVYATSELGLSGRGIVLRLLGDGSGRLLDVGCGGGSHMLAFAERGWTPIGVDVSVEQLALARGRGCDVLASSAEQLPFEDASFDAVVSMWTHTDLDDFPAAVREMARVLMPGGLLVYIGVHPCFVGPHSRYLVAERVPMLHPGYRHVRRAFDEAPGISGAGLRGRVGAIHLPLAAFLHAFLDADLRLDHIEEPAGRDYPMLVALRCTR